MPLTETDALIAAAYRVAFDRLNPDGCTDSAKFDALLAEAALIKKWASDQPVDICAAYYRVLTVSPTPINLETPPLKWSIIDRAARVLENNLRARQMHDAYDAIPKPPDPTANQPYWLCTDKSCVNGQSWRTSPIVARSLHPCCPMCGSDVRFGNPLTAI